MPATGTITNWEVLPSHFDTAVRDTYCGEAGCTCGCGGNYWGPDTPTGKRRVTRARKLWTQAPLRYLLFWPNRTTNDVPETMCFEWQTGFERCVRIYLDHQVLGMPDEVALAAHTISASPWTGTAAELLALAGALCQDSTTGQ
jgi:hypothetical protein